MKNKQIPWVKFLNCNNTIKIIRITKDSLDEKSPGGIMTTINRYFALNNKNLLIK